MNKNDMIILNNNKNENIQKNNCNDNNINNKSAENINLSQIIEEKTDEKEEDKNKEFFSNSPVIYLFLKIILLAEGQITRILLQLGDLYFSAIITNIYLEIMIIQLSASAESNTFIKIYAFISSLIFAFMFRIIITIAYWELYQLKWFDSNPFNSITDLLNLKLKKYMIRNIYIIAHIIFGIFFWLFLIGLLTMSINNGKFLDIINLIIFVILPILKFLCIYMTYIYIFLNHLICCSNIKESENNPFLYWLKLNNLINQGKIKVGNLSPEEISKEEDVGFFEKIFCKDILFQIKLCKEKIITITLKTFLSYFSQY